MKAILLVSAVAVALSAAAVSHRLPVSTRIAFASLEDPAHQAALEKGRTRRVCRVLDKLLPEMRRTGGVGAHAQLVTSMAAVFGDDPATVDELAKTVDEAAIESCPAQRDELLSLMQQQSLRDAIR